MSTEDDLVKHLDQVNQVVEEYLKGNDPTVISKQLDIPRQRVVTLINEWKVMASANDAIRARKAGLLENKELAEEMIEIERRQEVLVSILKDIASEYPQIRDEIMRRLSSFAKDNEVITVVHDVQ